MSKIRQNLVTIQLSQQFENPRQLIIILNILLTCSLAGVVPGGGGYLLDVNAAREEHVHELAVGRTRAQLLNFRIPSVLWYQNKVPIRSFA